MALGPGPVPETRTAAARSQRLPESCEGSRFPWVRGQGFPAGGLRDETRSGTVFGVVFWGLNTCSDGIWSTRAKWVDLEMTGRKPTKMRT